MHFGHNNPKYSYTMNGQTLASISNQRDLGVNISDNGLPGEQCALSAKKANQVLGQIRRSFTCQTKDILLQIYKVFVQAHLKICGLLVFSLEGSIWIQSRKYNAGPHTDIGGTYPRRLKRLNLTKLEDWRRQGEAIETLEPGKQLPLPSQCVRAA